MKKTLLFLCYFLMLQWGVAQELKPGRPDTVAPRLVLKGEMSVAQFDSLMKAEEQKKPRINFAAAIDKFDVKMVSPDGEYVVAFDVEHLYTDKLYFFSKSGELLAEHFIGFTPSIKFSYSGNYIEIFNQVGRVFYLFSKNGKLIKQGDYLEFTNSNGEFLTNILYIENYKEILFSTNKATYLYDEVFGVKKKIPGYCTRAYYDPIKKILLMNDARFEEKSMDIRIIETIKWENVEIINDATNFWKEREHFVIYKNKKIKRYEIN